VVFSVGADGTFAYLGSQQISSDLHELVWVTRSGGVTPVDDGETFSLSPNGNDGWRLSPDGRRIAFTRSVDGNDDIWVKALPEGPVSRLTFSAEMDLLPTWTPDGESVTYRNGPLGEGSLWSVRADGAGEPQLVFDDFNAAKGEWSPDGAWLVLRRAGVQGDEAARDIFAIRPGVDTAAVPLMATTGFWEQAPAISRDGRWLAYSSNETGRHEIFVRPFPDVDAGKWQVSSDGGINPVWAHNGRELFFLNPDTGQLVSAEFAAASSSFVVSRLTELFEVPGSFFWNLNGNNQPYDVDLDDQRFLMGRVYGSDDANTSFVLVQNFFQELERLIPD
jgi:Tol biopolymer transport system component